MSIDEVGMAMVITLRAIAFVIGLIILIVGLSNIGAIGGSNILSAFTVVPLGILEVPVGLVLMLAGIEPRIIAVVISWVIR
jgi:hypothetical protein